MWHLKYKQCLKCGTTERQHRAKGLCSNCYEKFVYRNLPDEANRQFTNNNKYKHNIKGFTSEKLKEYRQGGEGLIKWAEENIKRLDREHQRWVPLVLTDFQKETFKECLIMEKNEKGILKFKHRIIAFCRPRGDFKSYDVMLILLWRFFCFFAEVIVLGANSKEQVRFIHFDLARDTILNSPKLLDVIGHENIKEKGIYLIEKGTSRISKDKIINQIVPISAFTGLLSNITCAAFSEICDIKDEKFYIQLSGSIRSVFNAMILIDSTVAKKEHIFHKLYKQSFKDPIIYFQWYADKHLNPNMTEAELEHYKNLFPPYEYNRYFRNRWEDAEPSLFSPIMIKEMGIIGMNGQYLNHAEIQTAIKKQLLLEELVEREIQQKRDISEILIEIEKIKQSFIPVDKIYKIPASFDDLNKIKEIVKSEFIITIGLDRGEPDSIKASRTVVTVVAKSQIGKPDIKLSEENMKWLYFLLDLRIIEDPSDKAIEDLILEMSNKYIWIDNICLEGWATKDIEIWCNENGFLVERLMATQGNQKSSFPKLYTLMYEGLFKSPMIPFYTIEGNVVNNYAENDILREEMSVFEHGQKASKTSGNMTEWFGSPQKNKARGIKDDAVFSLNWAVYGGREHNIATPRNNITSIPAVINRDVVGTYS